MGKEQAVVIDIDFQRHAIIGEGSGQEIEISQEQFPLVDFGTSEDTAAVIKHVEHRKQLRAFGEPLMRGGVQLPKFTDVAALPSADRRGGAVVGPGVSEVVLRGPAADLSAVQFVMTQPQHLAGSEAVRGSRLTAQALA